MKPAHQEIPALTGAPLRTDWRGIRVKMSYTLPERVLRMHHRGYVRRLERRDELGDAVADGVLEMIRWDNEWPNEMTVLDFQNKAAGGLRLYYRRHQMAATNHYYKDGEVTPSWKAKREPWEGLKGLLTAPPPPELLPHEAAEVLSRLTEEERDIVIGRHYLGLTLPEIAAEMGVSRRTVVNRLDAIHENLREVLS
jgi:DNA-directed RNA polymerase specialized sigma24 family protein